MPDDFPVRAFYLASRDSYSHLPKVKVHCTRALANLLRGSDGSVLRSVGEVRSTPLDVLTDRRDLGKQRATFVKSLFEPPPQAKK